uniref:RNA helicase n=1 Tax=Heterorhabditis bacteriophora TaxID=37862 RepID=A0A1I7WTJ9_HETBA
MYIAVKNIVYVHRYKRSTRYWKLGHITELSVHFEENINYILKMDISNSLNPNLDTNDQSVKEVERILHTLKELIKNESRHSEFLPSVFVCLRSLERLGNGDDQFDDALRNGIDLLSQFYTISPPWIQSQIIDGLRRTHSWILITMFVNQFHHYCNGVSVPRHILFDAAFDAQFELNSNIPYAMAFGDNNSFNLGVAADGSVRDARLIPIIGVSKVSMSNKHTLFLTRSGDVFVCGCGINYKMGTNNDKVVVTPVKITFPGEHVPIIDIAAGSQHSIFISAKYIYVCGINNEYCIGVGCEERGPYQLKRIKLKFLYSEEQLKEVVTCDNFTVVSSSSMMWVAGRLGRNIYAEFTELRKDPAIFHGIDTSSVNFPRIMTYGSWDIDEGFNSFRTHSHLMSVQTATLPIDCQTVKEVKVDNRSDPDPRNWKSFFTFSEWVRIRIPLVDTYIRDGCLILNELSNNWNGVENECVMILANYINGMDYFWRNDDQISALKKFTNSLGISVTREETVYDGDRYVLGPKTRTIESIHIEKNCVLISIEGLEIEFSMYVGRELTELMLYLYISRKILGFSGDHRLLRPLKHIETEEMAIQELQQLYMETAGNDVIVSVERSMATPNSWRSRKNDKEDASGSWRSRRSDKDDASGSWRSRRNDKDDASGSWRNRRNDRDETNGSWRNRRNDRDETNGNLQYGVNAQHIDPSWESQVKKKLEQFAQSDDPQLIFPPMERHERKRLHDLARRWGLISSSSGREPNRTCIVSRRRPANLLASVAANETQPISLDMDMMAIIAQFIRENPIESTDIEKHLATLRVRGRTSRDTIFRDRVDKLIPPAHNCTDEMMRQRSQLPAFRQKEEVLSAIENHKVVLITGGTGCGKTTQVPQFLLEDAERRQIPLRIICTQPRRLPAISVADRVAKERGEKLGTTVGYHIRLEQKTSPQTVLTYCTSGVLLRMLTQDDTAKDVSHIILDEIHEREQNTDYLLIALKQALKKRDDLKVILMSATMEGNLKMFKQYFGDKVLVKHIDIPSRLFNVEKFFLGDVIAMTGFVPAESMFGGMFVTPGFSRFTTFYDYGQNLSEVKPLTVDTFILMEKQCVEVVADIYSFPAVDSWPSRGKNEWTGVDYYGKKNEWDTSNSKPDWETEPSNMHGMTEVQTAPNLASLVPTTSSNPPHLITSSSVSSLQPMQQNHQMHVENLLNVAQQLVNSQQSVSTTQMTQQYQQSPPAGSVHQNSPQYHQGSSMYQQASYQPSYVQQLPLFQTASCTQGNIVHSQQSNYVQAPTAVPLLHSATWGGGMDQSGYVHQPDVVDLPCDNLDPETLEQFRQIGGQPIS